MTDIWNQKNRDEEIARQIQMEREEQRRREEARQEAERREYQRREREAREEEQRKAAELALEAEAKRKKIR